MIHSDTHKQFVRTQEEIFSVEYGLLCFSMSNEHEFVGSAVSEKDQICEKVHWIQNLFALLMFASISVMEFPLPQGPQFALL